MSIPLLHVIFCIIAKFNNSQLNHSRCGRNTIIGLGYILLFSNTFLVIFPIIIQLA